MENINRQLNIGVLPRNTNIVPSGYARSTKNYQVQLGTEDPSLDYYNDVQSINSMSNANGWQSASGDRDLGAELMADLDEYNNASGLLFAYPACTKSQCKECKSDCKGTQGLRWMRGGKSCYKACRTAKDKEQLDRISALRGGGDTGAVKAGKVIEDAPKGEEGMGTGAMVGIAIGGLVIVGLAVFLLRKKK